MTWEVGAAWAGVAVSIIFGIVNSYRSRSTKRAAARAEQRSEEALAVNRSMEKSLSQIAQSFSRQDLQGPPGPQGSPTAQVATARQPGWNIEYRGGQRYALRNVGAGLASHVTIDDGISHKTAWGTDDLEHGTAVVIEKPDKLRPVTITALANQFKQTFGLVYRNYCAQRPILVQGEKVTAVDPLFLTPGAWAYDYDAQRANELEPVTITLPAKESSEEGLLTVRFSYMPYTFLRLDPDRPKEKGQRNNPRFQIADQNNGLIIMRAGRQLDVVTTSRGQDADIRSKFFVNNDDRTWAAEINFSPTLDDEFSVTTSKQGVKMSSRIWKALEDNNVFAAIRDMRKRYDQEKAAFKANQETKEDEKLPSEEVMEEDAKTSHEDPSNPDKERRGREGFEKEAGRRSRESGVPEELIKPTLKEETAARPWLVKEEDLGSTSTFYRLELVGGQKRLWINRGHRFYTQVYAGPESSPLTRAQWQVFLFILGDAEISGTEELRDIYEGARVHWSSRFSSALKKLEDKMPPAEPTDPDEPQMITVDPLSA